MTECNCGQDRWKYQYKKLEYSIHEVADFHCSVGNEVKRSIRSRYRRSDQWQCLAKTPVKSNVKTMLYCGSRVAFVATSFHRTIPTSTPGWYCTNRSFHLSHLKTNNSRVQIWTRSKLRKHQNREVARIPTQVIKITATPDLFKLACARLSRERTHLSLRPSEDATSKINGATDQCNSSQEDC